MKVLHINSYYYTGTFYKNLYDMQVNNGLDIDVYVPIPYSSACSNHDFGPYANVRPVYGNRDRFIFSTKHHKIYNDLVNNYNIKEFEISHAHSLFSNGMQSLKLKLDYKLPYIVAVRNTDMNLFFNKMVCLRSMGINILAEAKWVVFLSEAYKNSVIKKYVPRHLEEDIYSKAVVVPNGIDDYWFRNKINKKETPNNGIRILYVGSISKAKNVITTLKAVELLRIEGFNATLTIVGKVIDMSVYKRIKRSEFVNYISPVSKEKLLEIYRDSDIFAMPSITETFGLVYAEAMSQGLPVIYSKGQGFDGYFKDGHVGYSVPSKSVIDIAYRIKDILVNYDTISGNCVKEVDKFNWYKVSKKYYQLYCGSV